MQLVYSLLYRLIAIYAEEMISIDYIEEFFPVIILLSIILCASLVYIFYGQNKNIYRNFPPGPKPLPIIGNMHIFNLKGPSDKILQLSEQYGSVFSIYLGTKMIVVLCGYETVKDALVNYAEAFSGRSNLQMFHDIAKGHGIIFSHDENWKVMRRFTISTFREFGMGKKTIENKINEECDLLVQEIQSYKGEPFVNTMIINAAVANIIVSILLGYRFDYDDPTTLRLLHLINEGVRLVGSPMTWLYNAFPSIVRWLPGSHQTVLKNAAEMRSFVKETFTNHKKQLDVNDQRNLIDVFLVKQQEEKSKKNLYFHNDNLTMLAVDLFIAGMETTSSTLRWGLLLMMKYPDIQRKVQNEIERVIGSAQPQAEHRKKMPYTDAVIHEIQRFANIAPANLPHMTTQDVTFKGYFIPKNTQIIPLLTSVLKDKAHFEKPDQFYPEHFLDCEGNFVKNEAFMPFSAGRRICPGETLAKMELFLFFIRLLQNFTFQPTPGAVLDLIPEVGFTATPKLYYMRALPRSETSDQ
ncbi:cytochrome P450 2B19-like [Spea bombifrons]|uniref:cytochrome P450 2B19-like n=1 Tax=Spea bombifrons TaxID=233779 RepID=UPI00234B6845|nr:cytochrome P450 2B19-like [Spea bombifrons]